MRKMQQCSFYAGSCEIYKCYLIYQMSCSEIYQST
jgi:hypothetical protein